RVNEDFRLDLPASADSRNRRVTIHLNTLYSRTLRLRSWTTGVRADTVQTLMTGRVRGDSLLVVYSSSAEAAETVTARLTDPVVPPGAIPMRLAYLKVVRAGRSYSVPVFDPVTLQRFQAEGSVVAESLFIVPDSAVYDSTRQRWVPAHVDSLHAWCLNGEEQGLPVHRCVDEHGLLVRASTPWGIALERSAFEIVTENYRDRASRERVGAGGNPPLQLLAPGLAIGRMAPPLQRLAVRVGIADSNFSAAAPAGPNGGGQRWSGDTLVVTRVDSTALAAAYRLPADGEKFPSELRAEALMQADDPRVQTQASRVVGIERDPRAAAQRLAEWIAREIPGPDTNHVRLASAVQTLDSRRGDPDARVLLFVAMARAAGLPARVSTGVRRVERGFRYDAWPEVYLAGWVPVDLEQGRVPADASRLRFRTGGLGRPADLVPWLGGLRLKVVAEEAQPSARTAGPGPAAKGSRPSSNGTGTE
ncbi:MAG: transglutaminase domain-containing protein, partial [Gemmatimonadales bacterium]